MSGTNVPPALTVNSNGNGVVTGQQLNTYVQATPLSSDLRNFVGLSNMQVEVTGNSAPGDGGGGTFYYSSISTATDNGSTVIAPNGILAGRWLRTVPGGDASNATAIATGANTARTLANYFADVINVKDFGAVGNGVADDTAAFASMSAAVSTMATVPSGTYKITANLTLTPLIVFQRGAILNIATGVTVTFSAGLQAGVYPIFNCSGTGAVVINDQFTSTGYPEWWGAVTNNSSVDCSTAINACIVACAVTQLQQASYYTNNTIYHTTPNRTVVGTMQTFVGTGPGTFIVNQSSSNTIYQIGPNTYTGTLQNTNTLKYVFVYRSVAPSITAMCSGILMQFCVWTTIGDVISQDSIYAFNIRGTNQTHLSRCLGIKATLGTGSSTDKFYGFYLNGDTNIGFAGGNASLYITQCAASSGVTWTAAADYQGMTFLGTYGWSDVFVMSFETSLLGIGINLTGNGNTGSFDFINEDVRIYNPVLDTCNLVGINFNNISLYGAIQVIGGYVAFGVTGSGPTGIQYANSNGSVSVQQMEIYCQSNAAGIGISALNSKGILHKNNVVFECGRYPVVLDGVTNSLFEDQLRNYSIGNNQPAITLRNSCSRLVLRAMISGKANAFSQGYYLSDATTSYSEFACSGVDQSCITNSKLLSNGTSITTAGTFNTNDLASGIMN